jgi:glutathione S-transferase
METPMSEVTLYGFPRSVYVQTAGIILTHHEVAYAFHDLETEMNTPAHLALRPFERVPILRHGDFTLYETVAIVGYVDEVFGSCRLTPSDPQLRARMSQWMSVANGYYYPYLVYHVSHERNVFPQLGIASDEAVVAHAMPKVETCLQVLERELSRSNEFLLGSQLSLADFFICRLSTALALRPRRRRCTRNFQRFAPGASGWKACQE